ncbi:MAG: transcription elongation protein SprT [Flammeovirgaceae bacterium]
MNKAKLAEQLRPYTPQGTAQILADWIVHYAVSVKISPPRSSKLGDYRPPQNGQGHRISINGSLNPYAFLITFVHEVAHLVTWEQYQHKVLPHGVEWKLNFKKLMKPFLVEQVFPKRILHPLKKYMMNPAASSCRDDSLQKILAEYNPEHQHRSWHYLDEIPTGTIFIIENGRIFQKMEKLRKNFKCMEVNTKRMFRISPLMKVKVLEQ